MVHIAAKALKPAPKQRLASRRTTPIPTAMAERLAIRLAMAPTSQSYQEDPVPVLLPANISHMAAAPSEPFPTAARVPVPAKNSHLMAAKSATFPTAAPVIMPATSSDMTTAPSEPSPTAAPIPVPAIVSQLLLAMSETFPTAASTKMPATKSQKATAMSEILPTAATSAVAVLPIAGATARLSLALGAIQQQTLRTRAQLRHLPLCHLQTHLRRRRVFHPRRLPRILLASRARLRPRPRLRHHHFSRPHLLCRRALCLRRRRVLHPRRLPRILLLDSRASLRPRPRLRRQVRCRAKNPKGQPSLQRVLRLARLAKWQRHSKEPPHLRHFLPNLFVHNDFLC